MAWTLVIAYSIVALVMAVVVFALSSRLGDEPRPIAQRAGLSVAAGAVWPVMLLGLAEVGSFAVYAKVHHTEADDAGPLVGASAGSV